MASGFDGIFLDVLADNPGAIKLYQTRRGDLRSPAISVAAAPYLNGHPERSDEIL